MAEKVNIKNSLLILIEIDWTDNIKLENHREATDVWSKTLGIKKIILRNGILIWDLFLVFNNERSQRINEIPSLNWTCIFINKKGNMPKAVENDIFGIDKPILFKKIEKPINNIIAVKNLNST